MTVVQVDILVHENGVEVASMNIGYYPGQEYVVQIVTPDGVDNSRARKAGADPPLPSLLTLPEEIA